jgi:hypothetical protein
VRRAHLDLVVDGDVEGLGLRDAGLDREVDGFAEDLEALPQVDVLQLLVDLEPERNDEKERKKERVLLVTG